MRSIVFASLLALSVGSTVLAQSRERILVPFYTETPIEGAYGSRWTTELAVLNNADEPIDIGGYFQGCQFSACVPEPTPPGITFYPSLYETRMQGTFLHIYPDTAAEDVEIHLRGRDLSRQSQDWGSEVPTVPESRAPVGHFTILDVPNDRLYRVMLRLYHLGQGHGAQAYVRFFETLQTRKYPWGVGVTPDRELAQELVTFTAGSLTEPGYAELTSMIERHPELAQATRLRIEVESLTPGARIWGLLSITNNETQHVTYVTPSSVTARAASGGVVKPQCSVPAPLEGFAWPWVKDPDRYVVVLQDSVNVEQEAARLAQKFGFAVSSVFTIIPGFSAVMWSDAVALVRCEPSVKSVAFSETNIPPP